jgi:hypothetical protein
VVAKRLRVSPVTVCKWRGPFIPERLDGLYEEPPPGTPRQITDEQVEQVIVRTPEATRRGKTHWSSRGNGQSERHGSDDGPADLPRVGASAASHRDVQGLDGPLLIEKAGEIVGLYNASPTHAVVFCGDKKAQIRHWIAPGPCCRLAWGQVERRTHDCRRHWYDHAVRVKTSEVITQFHQRRRSTEVRQFLDAVDAAVAPHLDVHLIMDNSDA